MNILKNIFWVGLSVGLVSGFPAHAAESLVRVGAGSYTTVLPEGAQGAPSTIYRTDKVAGKMPSNDWWSSLAFASNSFAHFPHPLAVKTEAAGFRIAYPANLTANRSAIFGGMPGGTNDLILGHSAQAKFPQPLVDGFSDWFVDVLFAEGQHQMRVSYGHGSPFVYATYEGGQPRVLFAKAPQVWSGDEKSAVLGLTVNGKHYGLFGPSGATWKGLSSETLLCETGGKKYFSVAVLPDNTAQTLALFKRFAYTHVSDTRVEWSYDAAKSKVQTKFAFTTAAQEGSESGTLFALYPHQWRNTSAALLPASYNSVRGAMKLGQGASFTTSMIFPGVLPSLPNVGGCESAKISDALKTELDNKRSNIADTYWNGKQLGKLATLIPIAEQYNLNDATGRLRERLQGQLENWFSAALVNNEAKKKGLFYYDKHWGTVIGYPASYGSNNELNDHHFHYGYFIKGAAEIARHDPAWASDTRWGGMVKLLIRDIANADRADAEFPFLRCIDPYAGHSWASGHAKFADGNNNESSSEAMNAWSGIILWGEATGDKALRDLGIYLFTTEMNAINEYWFNVQGDNFPASYPASVVTMVWGGKGANGTWFSANPTMVHGINWMPVHGGSLYLGLYPDYVEKNYRALVEENKGTAWTAWSDIIWMYRALSNPADAVQQFEAADAKYKFEDGNSRANTAHWLYNLKALGQVNRAVTADAPLYAVFQNGTARTYSFYNMKDEARTVTFSDGHKLSATKKGFVTDKETKPGQK